MSNVSAGHAICFLTFERNEISNFLSNLLQSSSLIFGAHTKRHQLAIGDRVLALSDKGRY